MHTKNGFSEASLEMLFEEVMIWERVISYNIQPRRLLSHLKES